MTGVRRVEAFGVPFDVSWTGDAPGWSTVLAESLPPGSRPTDRDPVWRAEVELGARRWTLRVAGSVVEDCDDVDVFAHRLESEIGLAVADRSPRAVFVHAGVVGTGQGAIVLPGSSHAGKTTLVKALLERGCTYLSDEYAVLDTHGQVSAYPRRLSIRHPGTDLRQRLSAAQLGVEVSERQPVRAVVNLRYAPDQPPSLSGASEGDCAMCLVGNAVAAQRRPGGVLAVAAAVARTSRALVGVRGEAGPAADALLEQLAES